MEDFLPQRRADDSARLDVTHHLMRVARGHKDMVELQAKRTTPPHTDAVASSVTTTDNVQPTLPQFPLGQRL